jgi:hypothetical protein
MGFFSQCPCSSLRSYIDGDDGLLSSGILAFDASDNQIGDDFGKSLARHLPQDSWLKTIRLQNIGLSEEVALELKASLAENSTLDVLDISRNSTVGTVLWSVGWLNLGADCVCGLLQGRRLSKPSLTSAQNGIRSP